jgi:polyisoprenoid-binding protein YceI
MRKQVILAMAAAAVLGAGAASAAEADGKPSAFSRARRTIIHFGEDDIRGGITRPDGELVQAPRKVVEPSMLRVRRSFVDRALAAPLQGR